jgi:hypothetical protein
MNARTRLGSHARIVKSGRKNRPTLAGFQGVMIGGQAEAGSEVTAVLEDLVHFFGGAANRREIGDGVVEHSPANLGSDNRIAGLWHAEISAAKNGAAESVDHVVEFLVVEGGGFANGVVDAVEFDGGVDEIVGHAGDAFAADGVDVTVVRLILRKMAVDEALTDVEDDSVDESAVNLHPPGILVIPHGKALGVPGLVFASCVPTCDVDVVHAAIVKGRALGFMALEGHVARGHVADANDGEVADFALCDELLNFLVIPGVAVEQINRDETVAGFDFADELPFGFDVGRDGLFGKHMLAVGQGLADLLRTGICQGEQADGVDAGISKDGVGSAVDDGVRSVLRGEVAGLAADIVDRSHFPQGAFLHGGKKTAAHSPVAEDSRPEFRWHLQEPC